MTEFQILNMHNETWLLNAAGVTIHYWNLPITAISQAELMRRKMGYLKELALLQAPLALKAYPCTEDAFILPIEADTVLPLGAHPGAFGVKRKHHIHEGVDIYAIDNAEVRSMCEGTVIGIHYFTGPEVNQPHWLTTQCVMVDTKYGVLNYGEITPHPHLEVGSKVKRGTLLGNVTRVLKNDKGRPLHMLHFERYVQGTTEFLSAWDLDMPKPEKLVDPTLLLMYAFNIV